MVPVGLGITGKPGPGGGAKTSRLIVISVVWLRSIAFHYYLRICSTGRPSWLAPERAAVCVWASYGPGTGCPLALACSMGNARLVESISRENMSFFPILILMQNELFLAVRRLIFAEI